MGRVAHETHASHCLLHNRDGLIRTRQEEPGKESSGHQFSRCVSLFQTAWGQSLKYRVVLEELPLIILVMCLETTQQQHTDYSFSYAFDLVVSPAIHWQAKPLGYHHWHLYFVSSQIKHTFPMQPHLLYGALWEKKKYLFGNQNRIFMLFAILVSERQNFVFVGEAQAAKQNIFLLFFLQDHFAAHVLFGPLTCYFNSKSISWVTNNKVFSLNVPSRQVCWESSM